jgi:putative nucleotidyltransferase with HDIG domain
VFLDRIGLSEQYGVGSACFQSRGVRRLATLPNEGVAVRELQRLADAGLQWAVALRCDGRPLGILFFGSREDSGDLDGAEVQALDALLEAAAVALRNLERVEELRDVALGSLQGLVAASELRRPSDRGHAERVARGAVAVGKALGLPPRDLRDLALAGLLHDVGKLLISSDPEPSGATEAHRLRMHPVVGSRILSRAKPAPAVVQAVEQHHERWDGHGFPYGLRGDAIHLFARIVAISDAYDRWVAEESGDDPDRALRRLELAAGLLFDPGLVALFAAEVVRAPAGGDALQESWLEEIVAAP